MGTATVDAVESLAQAAASAAIHSRPRKADLADLAERWECIRGLLPQEQRMDDVEEAMAQVAFHGPAVARALFEAIARYALWYEGYSFGR